MPTATESSVNYIELTNQTYKLAVEAANATTDALLTQQQRGMEVLLRPLNPGAGVEANTRELIDRTRQIVAMAAGEQQHISQKNAEISEKILAQAAKVQDNVLNSWRNIWGSYED